MVSNGTTPEFPVRHPAFLPLVERMVRCVEARTPLLVAIVASRGSEDGLQGQHVKLATHRQAYAAACLTGAYFLFALCNHDDLVILLQVSRTARGSVSHPDASSWNRPRAHGRAAQGGRPHVSDCRQTRLKLGCSNCSLPSFPSVLRRLLEADPADPRLRQEWELTLAASGHEAFTHLEPAGGCITGALAGMIGPNLWQHAPDFCKVLVAGTAQAAEALRDEL